MQHRRPYPSDVRDEEWAILEPLIPPALPGGRPRSTAMREVVNAIFYLLRTGCPWRYLPDGFPPWKAVHHDFRCWRMVGHWEDWNRTLRERTRAVTPSPRPPSWTAKA